MNLYETLGVARDATVEAIKRAFRLKVKAVHPDVSTGNDVAAFNALVLAYQTLADPELREHYDETGQVGMPQDNTRSAALSVLSTVLSSVISHRENPIYHDQAKIVAGVLDDRLSNLEKRGKELDRATRRLKDMQGRWEPCGELNGGENVMEQILRAQLAEIARAAEVIERQRAECAEARAMLLNYRFRTEPPPVRKPAAARRA